MQWSVNFVVGILGNVACLQSTLDDQLLERLELENFRGFERHTLPIRPLTVIVGQNNAGKSTIVEALRLLSLVIARSTTLAYKQPPDWVERPKREFGILPSLRNIEIQFSTLTHQYADPPSTATAVLSSGISVKAYVNDGRLFAVIRDPAGEIIKTQKAARTLGIPQVAIMPQIGPVLRGGQSAPSEARVRTELSQRAEARKEDVFDNIASELQARNRKWQAGRTNKEARKLLAALTAQPSGILAAAPGKSLLSELSRWSAENHGVGLSQAGIAAEMRADEIDLEIRQVLKAIEDRVAFPSNM